MTDKEENTDIEKWSVSQLKKFLSDNNVDTSGCIEKSDYIALAKKTQSELASKASAAAANTQDEAKKKKGTSLGNVDHWSISELKVFLDYAGQDYGDCLDPEDFISLARRFIDEHHDEAEKAADLAQSYTTSKKIEDWTIPELELFLSKAHVNYDDCLEPEDYIKLAKPILEKNKDSAASTSAGTSAAAPSPAAAAAAASAAADSTTPSGSSAANDKKDDKKPKDGKKAPNFYEILEIPKDASQAQVTKAYYKLAKRYHPDKNPDNPEAEERFKLISEAYQVLSNPDKRKFYDQYGTTEEDADDPAMIFRMLFGGGRFDDYFCTPLSNLYEGAQDEGKTEEELQEEYRKKQEENINALVDKLRDLLKRIIDNDCLDAKNKSAREFLYAEAKEMSEAPGGAELLDLLGYVYVQSSKEYSSSFLGIPAFFARQQAKGHILKVTFSAIGSAAKMASMDGSEENSESVARQTLKTLWKTGKLEIEMTVRAVCGGVFDKCTDGKQMKSTVKAMKLLGDVFKEVGSKAMKEQTSQMNMPPKQTPPSGDSSGLD